MDRGNRGAARASARQRALRADDHQLRRGLQPLERFRCDALALRHRRSIPGAVSFTSAIVRSDEVWATSQSRFAARAGESTVRFAADRAEIHRRVAGIETMLDVTVASEDDVGIAPPENHQSLAAHAATRIHQLRGTGDGAACAPTRRIRRSPRCSSKRRCPEPGVLIAHRRPRSPDEPAIWTAHVLVAASGKSGKADGIQYETDRAKFLGRGNTTGESGRAANASQRLDRHRDRSDLQSRCRVALDPRERQEIAFVTMAAATREALLASGCKVHSRRSGVARFRNGLDAGPAGIPFSGHRPGRRAPFPGTGQPADLSRTPGCGRRPTGCSRNRLGQEGLWAYGISGDLPMLVVTLSEARNLSLVREVLLAHAYWRLRGFRADLVILNQEGPSYDSPLRTPDPAADRSARLGCRNGSAGRRFPARLARHSRRAPHADPGFRQYRAERQPRIAAAATGGGGRRPSACRRSCPPGGGPEEPSRPLPFLELPYFNGLGGFTPDGREYAIYLKPGATTPAPWVNVMANANFGTMVSESGLGFTWSGNSQTNRLTPWHNDPVSDPQSEVDLSARRRKRRRSGRPPRCRCARRTLTARATARAIRSSNTTATPSARS